MFKICHILRFRFSPHSPILASFMCMCIFFLCSIVVAAASFSSSWNKKKQKLEIFTKSLHTASSNYFEYLSPDSQMSSKR